ncbi:MAG: phosphatidate cytidylyltransferase [Paramuribaculum sp.]|nr:phosphatidate cytidylyltransferase [Paramuribaculum sp.]MDE6651928.1 phosphatidate cytidylyltransferase [Paramuribaculum sp.]
MNKILVRSLSGAVYVALIVCSLIYGSYWAFPLLCAIFSLLGVAELEKIESVNSNDRIALRFIDMAAAFILALFPAFSIYKGTELFFAFGVSALILLFLVRLISQLYISEENALSSISSGCLGIIYVAVPLSLISVVSIVSGPQIVLAMFIMIWINDTGAFLVGSTFGKHRLFERISPKKSWEGFWGGFIFSIAAGVVIHYLFGKWNPTLSLPGMCVLGALISVFATFGDLVESLIKRTVHIKDSGHIMPGHGGILDRIDSLLIVSPALVLFLIIDSIIRYI